MLLSLESASCFHHTLAMFWFYLKCLKRWNEHQVTTTKSEPTRHIQSTVDHDFSWKVLCTAPNKNRERKNLEACFTSLLKPSFNEQVEFKVLTLFRHGVTWSKINLQLLIVGISIHATLSYGNSMCSDSKQNF